MNLPPDFFSGTKARTYLLLALLPLIVYAKGFSYPFSPMDEQWLITHNVDFLKHWSNILQAFHESIESIYYRPLFLISLIFDYHLGALHPRAYHVMNMAWHLGAVFLLFRFLLLLRVEPRNAFFLCVAFSVHPVLVHAVEWIPGRNDSMLAVFGLLSFSYLVRYLTENKNSALLLHLLFFALALFTKETAIALPLAYAAFYLAYKKPNKDLIAPAAGWLVGLGAWYIVRNALIDYFPSDTSDNFLANLGEFFMAFMSLTGKAVFPVYQSVAPVPSYSWLITGCATIALLVFLYYRFGVVNRKIALAGLSVFVILLAMPVWYSTLNPLGEQYEHRMYLPLAGLFIFISQLRISFSTRAFNYVIVIVLLSYSVKSFSRIDVYKSELNYLNEGIEDSKRNYVFYFMKANVLAANGDLNSAETEFSKAINLNPSKPQSLHNRANVYREMGRYKEAVTDYNAAMKLAPNNHLLQLDRCKAYIRANEVDSAMSDLKALDKCCKAAIPPELYKNVNEKWFSAHLSELNAKIQADPMHADYYVARARIYFSARKLEVALADLKKACELDPGNAKYKTYYDQLNSSYKH